MKISEARQLYSTQIRAYQEKKNALSKQKKALEQKINTIPNGNTVYADEAVTLELTMQAVDEKQAEYKDYMEKLLEQWSLKATMVSSKQQSENAQEYAQDIAKIMEVARRLMKGAIVPPTDEKKLMEYSMELYQAAKNMGSLAKQKEKEEYESLWDEEDEKKTVQEDPMEVADNTEAFASGPEIVEVEDVVTSIV